MKCGNGHRCGAQGESKTLTIPKGLSILRFTGSKFLNIDTLIVLTLRCMVTHDSLGSFVETREKGLSRHVEETKLA